MSFKIKLELGRYGEEIVKDWLISKNHKVNHYIERNDYDMDIYKNNGDIYKADIKTKISMLKYPSKTGLDANDWDIYNTFDINKFVIFFVDRRFGKCYGDTIANLKIHAQQLFNDSTKYNKFPLITLDITKMRTFFALTDEQMAKLKELENNKGF